MYGMWLVLVLVLMGGSIAYLGDAVGMWVGRKRLTLFGLRPKHSSMVVTIVTGTLIAGASLTVLSFASSDVRTALFRMKEIEVSLAQTHEALLASEDELGLLKAMLARQRGSTQELVDARDRAVAERDAALEELEALQSEAAEVRVALDEARAELEDWKGRVASLRELAESLEDSVQKLQASESKLRGDLAALSQHYLSLENRMRSGEFVYLKGEIVAATVIRGAARERVQRDLGALLDSAASAAQRRGAGSGEDEQGPVQVAGENRLAQAVERIMAQPGSWVARAVALQNTVRGEPLVIDLELIPETVIYRAGEVIGERVLQGGRPHPEAQILSLIDEVNQDAVAKGMVTGDGEDAGHFKGEEFVDALITLRRIQGPARLAAVAVKETRNTDAPLEIRLVVEPAG